MLEPISEMINGAIDITLPFALITIIVIVPIRLLYLKQQERDIIIYKELFYLSIIIYLLALINIVTFENTTLYYTTNNFTPFKEILRYDLGSRLFIKNIIGNIVLFIPYGILATYFLRLKKVSYFLLIVTITSLLIESTQLLIGRIFDIDDIILNVVGGLSGYVIYKISSLLYDKVPSKYKKEWILNVVSIIILIGVIYFL